jgi:sec-independent protein translocase protein TatA
MGSMSIVHWLIVLAVVVLLFGPRRLPELAKGMGEAIREFKKAVGSGDQQKTQITSGQQNTTNTETKV